MSSPDRFSVAGRRVLATGSTQGMGLGICQGLAQYGASHVFLNSEREGDISARAVASIASPAVASHLCVDLSVPGAGARLAETVLEETGGYGVDILVLAASVQFEGPWLEMTAEQLDLQITVNLKSSLELLQRLVPTMRERRWGRVVIISSVQATRPSQGMLVYASTKAALANISANLAKIHAADGITFNTISPGLMNTPRNEHMQDPEYLKKARNWVPMKRVGEVEDCVGAALLLCSEAGSFMTGTDVRVDGGGAL